MKLVSRPVSLGYPSHVTPITLLAPGRRRAGAARASNTVVPRTRWWVLLAATLVAAACGGRPARQVDQHAQAESLQQRCCESLTGPGRDQCLAALPRVDDPWVARTDRNQDTYACVARYFVCDPTTGAATTSSAQAQLECVEELDD
ncbi:MAG: hypothetical protein KBG28_09590 [Kofleriaceae bacterium]|jgi:hypothetical protein|nr:hypothetical protein [Kofleriaceae bacterium]MBP6841112.1 hypothetical protein [Kofleriaceae bacterium]MBP9204204.1 hypothetical protein [Kofleriaceae bacterium]